MKKITLSIVAIVVTMCAMAVTPIVTTEWQFGSVNPTIAVESFENCPAAGLPLNWTRFAENVTLGTVTNATAWVGNNTERSITGTYSAKMANYQSVSDCWLVTPKLTITAASATAVSFYWSNTAGDYGSTLDVYVSESATQPVASTTFTVLVKSIAEGNDGILHLENLDLTAFVGKSIYLGFKVHNFGNPANPDAGGDNWWIEDVKLPLVNMIGVGNNARGMGFGMVNSIPTLALVSREGGNSVRIINTVDGTQTASLNVTGITGGAIAINDAGITTDGKILVSNVASGSATVVQTFKVYRWDNFKDAPTVAISYVYSGGAIGTPTHDLSRYGDHITVTGSITAGTAKVYAASSALSAASLGVAKVLCFSMIADVANPGLFIFDSANPTVVSSAINWAGAIPSVLPLSDGTFLYKGNANSMRIINANGTLSANVTNNGIVAIGGCSVQLIRTIADSTYVTYLRWGTGQEKADILRIVKGDLAGATVVGTTPALGTNANTNGTGRVVVDASGTDVYLYVLSSNNGFGKYKVTGIVDTPTEVKQTRNSAISLTINQNNILIQGTTPSSIELFNTLGQKVQSVINKNELTISNLRGVHIVKVNVNGVTSTQKINL
jgi:hypothetical protein